MVRRNRNTSNCVLICNKHMTVSTNLHTVYHSWILQCSAWVPARYSPSLIFIYDYRLKDLWWLQWFTISDKPEKIAILWSIQLVWLSLTFTAAVKRPRELTSQWHRLSITLCEVVWSDWPHHNHRRGEAKQERSIRERVSRSKVISGKHQEWTLVCSFFLLGVKWRWRRQGQRERRRCCEFVHFMGWVQLPIWTDQSKNMHVYLNWRL